MPAPRSLLAWSFSHAVLVHLRSPCIGPPLLWLKGSGNTDDVIGLLEQILSIAIMAVALLAGHLVLLELAGLGLSPAPHRGDLVMPF